MSACVVGGGGVDPAWLRAVLGEPVGGLQLEPGAAALLLVGGDPVPSLRCGPWSAGAGRGWSRASGSRQFSHRSMPTASRVQVSAGAAAARGGGDRAFLAELGRRQGHGDDLVAGALVVDHRAGAELGDADEPGPLDVVALAAAVQAGDVGGQRQPGERVAGQEALGGEVPVGVEVGLEVVGVLVAKQVQLDAGVGWRAGRPAPGPCAGSTCRPTVPDCALNSCQREPVQVPPPVARVVERLRPRCWRRRRSRSPATRVRVAARAACAASRAVRAGGRADRRARCR